MILGNNCFYFDAENSLAMNDKIADVFDEKAFNQVSEIRNNGYNHIISTNNSIGDRVKTIIETLK